MVDGVIRAPLNRNRLVRQGPRRVFRLALQESITHNRSGQVGTGGQQTDLAPKRVLGQTVEPSETEICEITMIKWPALILMFFAIPAFADEIALSRFGSEGIKGWESKSFKGTTEYTIVQENGRSVLKAHAKAAASGLSKKITFKPAASAT